MVGIYCITNLVNGKKYVGQSTNIENRWKMHQVAATRKSFYGYDYPLYAALRKYGVESFKFEVLEECSQERLDDREIYWIDRLETFPVSAGKGYNIIRGGKGNSRRLTTKQILEIINLLSKQLYSYRELAEQYGVCRDTIAHINKGTREYKIEGITYPIVANYPHFTSRNRKYRRKGTSKSPEEIAQRRYEAMHTTCPLCGKPMLKSSTMCSDCIKKKVTKKLSRQEILIKFHEAEYNREKAAELCNVAGNTLRKWCHSYGIPIQQKNQLKELYRVEVLGEQPKVKNLPVLSPVVQIDPDTQEIMQVFESQGAATKWLGLTGSTGLRYAIAHGTIYHGFYWRNVNTEE